MNLPLQCWLRLPDGARHELNATCSIGRAPENSLQLADSEVSRRHALIQAQGEQEFWLVDLGSANGTHINGRRLGQATRLSAGDKIRMGKSELEFGSQTLHGQTPTMPHARQVQCWLMVADIVGSTQLAQTLAPEEYPRVTGAWFKTCRQIIEECGGHVSKYLSDGFFCHWEDTADSAIQVRQAVARLSVAQVAASPPFRVVLHFGPVALGTVPAMNELNLHGPEVNFVSCLEKVASTLKRQVLFSEAATRQMKAESEVGLVGESAVEGFPGPHRFYSPGH